MDADVDIALALGLIGQLVGARDHLGRQRLHMLLVNVAKHRLHGQGAGRCTGAARVRAALAML